jgi:hypothetical protein
MTNVQAVSTGSSEADRDAGRRLPTLVLDRETIRDLSPRTFEIEAVGKKKTKTWPECGDTTTAKPKCPIIEPSPEEPLPPAE